MGTGGDPAGAGPMGGGGTTIASSTGPCLTVSFNLADDGGQFGPRNIGAIWVTRGDGTYIRTLKVWANKRAKYLTHWLSASGGDKVDAVTSATMNSLGSRSVTWDCTDKTKALVPEGDYLIHAEMTEDDATGPSTVMTASLHPGAPFDQMLGTDQNFLSRHLVHPP